MAHRFGILFRAGGLLDQPPREVLLLDAYSAGIAKGNADAMRARR